MIGAGKSKLSIISCLNRIITGKGERQEKMNKPLKILFLSNRGPLPIKDGQTRRTFNILKGLSENNQVHLCSLFETPEEIEVQNIKKLKSFCHKVEFYPSPSKKVSIPMIARLLRSLFSCEPYTIWRHYSKTFYARVDKLIQKESFDIVHCDILPIVYTIRNKENVFRSLTDHDVSYLKCLRMADDCYNIFLRIFCYLEASKLKKLESRIFDEVELGIVVSEVDKKILKKVCRGARFEVIENGVDVEKFKPGWETIEPNSLIWLGGFDHHPNKQGIYWFLDNVYPIVKQKTPEVILYVIGGGVTTKLRRYASADPSINILGYVDDPIPHIKKATAFISPILSGSGTRLKVLEAMAAGKAIVTTSIGCEGIEGTNNKHFLIADKPEAFARKILNIFENKNLTIEMSDNARKLALQKYDWKIITVKLNNVYFDCVKINHLKNNNLTYKEQLNCLQ